MEVHPSLEVAAIVALRGKGEIDLQRGGMPFQEGILTRPTSFSLLNIFLDKSWITLSPFLILAQLFIPPVSPFALSPITLQLVMVIRWMAQDDMAISSCTQAICV